VINAALSRTVCV